MKKLFVAVLLLLITRFLSAQPAQYRVSLIGFYNLENLYDTVNNPMVDDEEFLPKSERHYNTHIYLDKLDRLSDVISQIGTDINPDGVAILGIAEIENDTVINDLIHTKALKNRGLKFVHYNSPDVRGVDVGMIYNPKYFKVLYSEPLFVRIPGGAKDSWATRDVLYVKGILDGDTAHFFVNHWPSRRGGEERSAPARAAAAGVVKKCADSLYALNGKTKVIVMGDLNDDPISPSLTKVLGAKGRMADVKEKGLFNPWMEMYRRGIGTSPYQDAWGLFDQILVSEAWLSKDQPGYHYRKAMIFNKEFMVQKTGKWRGYSRRTWDGTTYNYGYSDHFPVYVMMAKRSQ